MILTINWYQLIWFVYDWNHQLISIDMLGSWLKTINWHRSMDMFGLWLKHNLYLQYKPLRSMWLQLIFHGMWFYVIFHGERWELLFFLEVLSEWMTLFLESRRIRWQRCSFLLNRAKSFCGRSQDDRANSQTPESLLFVAQILIFGLVRHPLFVAQVFCLGHFGWISMIFLPFHGGKPSYSLIIGV